MQINLMKETLIFSVKMSPHISTCIQNLRTQREESNKQEIQWNTCGESALTSWRYCLDNKVPHEATAFDALSSDERLHFTVDKSIKYSTHTFKNYLASYIITSDGSKPTSTNKKVDMMSYCRVLSKIDLILRHLSSYVDRCGP